MHIIANSIRISDCTLMEILICFLKFVLVKFSPLYRTYLLRLADAFGVLHFNQKTPPFWGNYNVRYVYVHFGTIHRKMFKSHHTRHQIGHNFYQRKDANHIVSK